uniref:Uncharacterized protein n=1 Tax=Myotis myotis TaxID=51298 RepID=A0A7J7TJM3_MYOMY|nr:hypothetical protein mMyoMyo1_009030 [Myotis myotis]
MGEVPAMREREGTAEPAVPPRPAAPLLGLRNRRRIRRALAELPERSGAEVGAGASGRSGREPSAGRGVSGGAGRGAGRGRGAYKISLLRDINKPRLALRLVSGVRARPSSRFLSVLAWHRQPRSSACCLSLCLG